MENEKKEFKIFIVEDDFIFTNILIGILDELVENYNSKNIEISYKTYYSAKEAEYELQKKPDIVLLDYYIMDDTLQPLTALDFIKNVNSGETKTNIIVISGQEDQTLIQEIKAMGITAYLGKDPDSLSKLNSVLSEIIEKKLN